MKAEEREVSGMRGSEKRKSLLPTVFHPAALLFAVLLCVLLAGNAGAAAPETDAEAAELHQETKERLLAEFDFQELDDSLKKIFPNQKIRFSEVVETLISGELETGFHMLCQYGKDQIGYEFQANKENLVYMLLIAVIAAVFTNFSNALQNRQASEISFYVLYILLITLCLNSFRIALSGLEGKLESILDFMHLLCPAYFLSVAFASGSGSSLLFYNWALLLIYLTEVLLLRFLLPVINIYIMIQVMNYMLGEEVLTEFAELIKKGVSWTLKTVLGLVAGINVIQGLLAPVMDTLKRSALTKTAAALPGVGNAIDSAADVLLGTAVLIKNGIGMAGAVVLVLICAVPVLQMLFLTFLYKLAAALVQPVSDSRITGCISSMSEGYELLLQLLFTTVLLFLITIAVVAASTT